MIIAVTALIAAPIAIPINIEINEKPVSSCFGSLVAGGLVAGLSVAGGGVFSPASTNSKPQSGHVSAPCVCATGVSAAPQSKHTCQCSVLLKSHISEYL